MKDITEYIDEALTDQKVCPMIMEDIQTDPIISKEYHVQKTVKQLLKTRFVQNCPTKKLFKIIYNKISNSFS
ncbi:MAG: hypothetical protein AB1695_08835 [Stygiobacter sp.]|jgi:3-isopropylmalate dehydratase small subunit|uniref:Uncharacterized protein n=1 Tax=Stygiobacter electus TaxID=3032292 RepID=A0AAE3TCY5_9BACT|nr:hypothetical protein [Stygiobacter electus]MDF1611941.1 hypothetical protein [Stygiobacter electus]